MAGTSKDSNLYNRTKWEDADFPMLCQTCLGDNPYIRMTKDPYGKECKICTRPFTIFRWCPGRGMRFKKTEICQTCAKMKNVCQTCMLDLVYGLPVQVRDAALKLKDTEPKSDVNREYHIQNVERALAESDGTGPVGELGKAMKGSEILSRLARHTPYYKRNLPHICSFWVKGECKRGDECPYRHELPLDPTSPLAKQNFHDRFYGTNDPVAEKMLRKVESMPKVEAPADKSITTLFVGGVDPAKVTEQDLRDHFYQFGEIRTIHCVARSSAAFVEFVSRDSAERAMNGSHGLTLRGQKLRVLWGRGQATAKASSEGAASTGAGGAAASAAPAATRAPGFVHPSAAAAAPFRGPPFGGAPAVPGLPGMVPMPGMAGPPPVYYPSMDPQRMGSYAPRPAP